MKNRRTLWICCSVAALSLLLLAAYSLKLFEPLPLEAAASSSRLVLDRDGHLLRAFTTPDGRWRLDAKPEDVSPTYLSLLLAFEDRRFWKHPGVDPLALRAGRLQARPARAARLRRLDTDHAGGAAVARLAHAFASRQIPADRRCQRGLRQRFRSARSCRFT